jgi:hypothetical protein
MREPAVMLWRQGQFQGYGSCDNVAIIELQYGPRSQIFGTVGWASLAIFSVYLFNSYVLYLHGR